MPFKYPFREKQTLFILQAEWQTYRKPTTDSTSFTSIITEDNDKKDEYQSTHKEKNKNIFISCLKTVSS